MDTNPRKRIRVKGTQYPKLEREYDQNVGNRRAYMTLLASLPHGHIIHCTRVRDMITSHLMVRGVRRETRAMYKLINRCKPYGARKLTKAIREGTTIYNLKPVLSPMHTRISCSKISRNAQPHISSIEFSRCKALTPWTMDWASFHQLVLLEIGCGAGIQLKRPLTASFCCSLPNLHFLQLTGGVNHVPPEIDQLQNLQTLRLNSMDFTKPGSLPASIGNLPFLKDLIVETSNLCGPIPDWIFNLKRLQRLELGKNKLTGPIPSWLPTMPLYVLDLSSNQLTGKLNLEQMTNLNYLDVNDNQFDFGLPPKFRPHIEPQGIESDDM